MAVSNFTNVILRLPPIIFHTAGHFGPMVGLFLYIYMFKMLMMSLTGPNWPAGGEIDIVEGVNDYTNNQATIHTNPGCSIPSSNSTILGITGSIVGGTNCASAETDNQGCGIRAAESNSFGAGVS